jgi:hypothetical protein
MAEQRILAARWRDEQRDSKYPFADTASLRSQEGLRIAADVFLDASLHPASRGTQLGIRQIDVAVGRVAITLGDSAAAALASASFDPLHVPDVLSFADAQGRTAGLVVLDTTQAALFQTWPTGRQRFLLGAAEFAVSVVQPLPVHGLAGVRLEDGTVLSGEIWLVGEDGVVVREVDPGVIRVDVVGDPLSRRRQCDDVGAFTAPRCLRTINGVPADERGEFFIVAGGNAASDTVLRVRPVADGLRFEIVGRKIEDT